MTKRNVGRKGLIPSYRLEFSMKGNQDRNSSRKLGAETETESLEEWFFLVCSPWLSLPAFLHNPGPPAQEGHSPHVLGPPTSVINQENTPLEMPTDQSVGGNPSVEVPSCQMTLVCVKMAKTTQHSCGGHSVIHVINVVELCAFNAYNGKMYILHNLP